MTELYFDGSVWCNIDVVLRRISPLYKQETEALGLSIVEWYVLQILFEQDGQTATSLAQQVGRPSTAFTPILDRIEKLGFIERHPHPFDRRAVSIRLTASGKVIQKQIQVCAEEIEHKLRQQISEDDWLHFAHVVAMLQTLEPNLA